MTTGICNHCKKPFNHYPSHKRTYCSRKCADLGARKYVIKARDCIKCGVVFMPSQRGMNRANAKYCSQKCRYSDKRLYGVIGRKGSKTRKAKWDNGEYQPPWNKGKSVRLSPKSEFKRGSVPWNKGVKGIHLSPQSEFKKGSTPVNKVPVGTTKIRCDHKKREGRSRKWIKVAEPNKWMLNSRYAYSQYDDLVDGMVIHHVNHDTLDDSIDNLEQLTKAEHGRVHK